MSVLCIALLVLALFEYLTFGLEKSAPDNSLRSNVYHGERKFEGRKGLLGWLHRTANEVSHRTDKRLPPRLRKLR